MCCKFVLIYRSRLILSESLAHQNPCSPFRRAPSTLVHREQTNQDGYLPFSMETDDLLRVAKTNIERLKMKEKRVLIFQALK